MQWGLFIPELYFMLMIGVFLCLAMVLRSNPKRDFFIALLLATVGVVVCLASVKLEGTLFFNVYRVDLFSQVFKLVLATGFFLVICICSELKGIQENHHPEFYLLMTTCTLAMMLLVSSVELLTIYVALELSSYSLYLLVPLRKGYGDHVESGIKYFLVGAFTSAVMLFGIASLYGVVHTTYVAEIITVLPGPGSSKSGHRFHCHGLQGGGSGYPHPNGCPKQRQQHLSCSRTGYSLHRFHDSGKSSGNRAERHETVAGLLQYLPRRLRPYRDSQHESEWICRRHLLCRGISDNEVHLLLGGGQSGL